jgi:NADPH:quinone reductase-like Zn-dependent oxidoreductase
VEGLTSAGSTNDRPGAFAEYITARYDLLWTVPAAMSLEDAASVSMCGLTAAQGVFYRLGLPAPFWPAKSKPDTEVQAGAEAERHPTPSSPIRPETSSLPNVVNVLIYGASTSLGMYAAQLVRLAERHLPPGTQMRVIGAARTDKHPFLRAPPYRYDELVDYRDDNWPAEVRAATGGAGVQYALDTISEGETVSKVESTFADSDTGTRRFAVFRGPAGGRYDPSGMRVKPIYGAAWEGLGVEIGYNGGSKFPVTCNRVSGGVVRGGDKYMADCVKDGVLPASASAREFAARFFAYLGTAADDGEIKLVPNPVRIMPGGLERVVPDGFALLGGIQVSDRKTTSRAEQYMRPISAEKIVYSLVR